MKKMALVSLAVLVLATQSPAFAQALKTKNIAYDVVPGIYVHEDFPPCWQGVDLMSSLSNPTAVAAITEAIGPEAGAVVLVATQWNHFVLNQGGDIARLYKQATGQSWSACKVACTALNRGESVVGVNLTYRTGHPVNFCLHTPRSELPNPWMNCKDWSGWRDVVLGETSDGREMVCATAVNWSHNQPTAQMLQIEYR